MTLMKSVGLCLLVTSLGLAGCTTDKPAHLASAHKVSGGSGSQLPGAAGAGDNNGPSGGAGAP
jgi:hypothetical protein